MTNLASRKADLRSDFPRQRRIGRIALEIILITGLPCCCLGGYCLWDSEFAQWLTSAPSEVRSQLEFPVMSAVRIGRDQAITVEKHGHMRVWSFSQTKAVGEMHSWIADVSCMAYSPTQNLLALGSDSGELEVWDLDHPDSPTATQTPDLSAINQCQFTADGKRLLTASQSGKLFQWQSRTLKELDTLERSETRDHYRSLAISSEGHLALVGTSSGNVHVWDLANGQHLRSIQASRSVKFGNIESLHFLPGDQEFVAASRDDGVDVWNVVTGRSVRHFAGPTADLKTGELSPDGQRFSAGMLDGRVLTWDTTTGHLIGFRRHDSASVNCLLYSADGQSLLTGDWNGRVEFRGE